MRAPHAAHAPKLETLSSGTRIRGACHMSLCVKNETCAMPARSAEEKAKSEYHAGRDLFCVRLPHILSQGR